MQYQQRRGQTSLEEILGSSVVVKNLGASYQNHSQDLDKIASYMLKMFNNKEEYSSKENLFYRMAQADILKMLEECRDEALIKN